MNKFFEALHNSFRPRKFIPRFMPGRFLKLFFKIALFTAVPGYVLYNRYQHYLEKDPKFLRDNITDILLNNERLFQDGIAGKLKVNLLTIIHYLMSNNLIPGSNIKDENLEKLKCNFLGKDYSYPIGLNVGLDLTGTWCLNLSKLGFEFVMIGPFSDVNDNSISHDKDEPKENPGGRAKYPLIAIDYALYIFNSQIEKVRKANLKNLGVEVFVSTKTHTMVPYLTGKKLSILLDNALTFADSVNIELARVNEFETVKFKNPEKLKVLLEKIKSTVYKNLALKACYEYEYVFGVYQNPKSVSSKIRPISSIIRKKRPNIFVRIADDCPDEYLDKLLLIIMESSIVDAIILDANMDDVENRKRHDYEYINRMDSESNERIKYLRSVIGQKFPIISSGAINTGQDVFCRIQSGADFVLIDSAFKKRGPYCLEKIAKELNELMVINNYSSIKELRQKGAQLQNNNFDLNKFLLELENSNKNNRNIENKKI